MSINSKFGAYFAVCIFAIILVIFAWTTSDSAWKSWPSESVREFKMSISSSSDEIGILGAGYYLEKCKCYKHRRFRRLSPQSSNQNIMSTCSEEADWYGGKQSVVTFTLHEDKNPVNQGDKFSFFLNGILTNLQQIRVLYPGWILRIYSDLILDDQMCAYACLDDIMWCDIKQPRMKNLVQVNFRSWRFMVIGDPTVDIFVSRDLDSWILDREREAVAEWEVSNLTFHCTRDFPHHDADMWAGAWGAKNYALNPTDSVNLRNQFMEGATNNNSTRLDENLLTKFIFKKFPKDIMAHDAYRCRNKKHISVPSVPFPTKRILRSEFVAISIGRRNTLTYSAPKCPVDCRPSYGKDWDFC